MLKRPFKSLIARIAIVALALSLVVPFVPAAFAQDTSIGYAENGTSPVATFTATDADGDAIAWSLSGADAEDFTIVGGVLAFKSSPNYESPGDEGSDNVYNVTLEASGGSSDVVVTVTNVDEMGTVDIKDLQPQSGEPVGAEVSDEDGSLEQTRWQWAKSMDQAAWEDISGASSPTYTPATGDIGYYLRATATYSDGLGTGRDSASAVTAFAVEERPVANAGPAFEDTDDVEEGAQQTRTVKETAEVGDSVGNAVTASDADNDPLLYSLTDGDGDATDSDSNSDTPSDKDGDSLSFKIDDERGQITTAVEMPDQDAATPVSSYSVTVTATDPSGSTATVVVTINVVDVNEAPKITLLTAGLASGQTAEITTPGQTFVVTTPEQDLLDLESEAASSDAFSIGLPVFDANDPEEDTEDKITWSISGADAKRFQIAKLVDANGDSAPNTGFNSSAALRWSSSDREGPSFEAMDSADGDNVYDVTVTAFDGVASNSQDVSITVTNVEEPGSVELSQRTPQEGRAITAGLSDPDGGVTGAEWQWYRGDIAATDGDSPANGIQADELVALVASNMCDAAADTNCWIKNATSSTYIPTADDAGSALTAVVTYTDAFVTDSDGDGDDGDTARATSDSAAVVRPNANAQPTFVGDDESVERSVVENADGVNVGEPVTFTDDDLLMYALSGDGSDAFDVNNDGQITTVEELDFETQSSYTVTVTATDPSGASDSIVVNITVTDADDGATISTVSSVDYAEGGTEPVASFSATDPDGDAIVWSLSGPDAEDFTIVGGVLAFESSPDYESPGDQGSDNIYNVTVNASGGSTDVVVTVTNVDEAGSVTLTDLQPQSGEPVGAEVSDEDGSLEQTTWQWSKSMDKAAWEEIDGATSPTYTPTTDDVGYYLQATATYSDGLGTERESASAVTAFAVEERPVANAGPAFEDTDDVKEGAQQTRTVKETAEVGDSVGNAVTASDADNDPLLYSLTDGDGDATDSDSNSDTPSDKDGDSLSFKIDDERGQITTAVEMPDQDAATPVSSYSVTVTATDPSGSTATVVVTINVVDVNEAPKITLLTAGLASGQTAEITTPGQTFVVTTPEQDLLDLESEAASSDAFSIGLPVFDANDPEEDTEDKITWSISGADAKRFQIAKLVDANGDSAPNTGFNSSAALRWSSSDREGPSFEAMDSADGDNVYDVTVTAFDGVASNSQDVSITVTNVEEPGSVELSQLTPREGRAITAGLSDPDGGVTGAEWQWYKGVLDGDSPADGIQEDELPDADDATEMCDAAADTNCWIKNATSSTYIPTADDAGSTLTAVVTYTDAFVTDSDGDGDDGDTAIATSDSAAVVRPNANAQPTFDGDDESVERSVVENADGVNVGEPVTFTDDDGDLLIYTLSGDGSDAFDVNNDGQITTVEELDFETQSSYTVMVTATDPSGASDSITVNITVTDADDGAIIQISTENSAPAFADESVTLSVDENTEAGAPVGDPITATDKDGQDITYSLDDSSVVEIWPSGQLTVAEGANLDYEGDANSYTVVLTASDGVDSTSIMVTINVNNVGLDNGYDTDDNGEISKDEAVTAVDDYFLDNITREEVNAILALYFG